MKDLILTAISSVFTVFLIFPSFPAEGKVTDESVQRLVDINACIEFLESTGDLIRVKPEVDQEYELAGIAKKFEG